MTPWTVREVPVPTSLDADDAWLLHGLVDAFNEASRAAWGTDDFATTARRALAGLASQQYTRRVRLVAVDGATDAPDPGRVLGAVALDLPATDNTHTGWLELAVRPEKDGSSTLRQLATFYPRGLAGQLYWWGVSPFHGIIFGSMQRGMRLEAERIAAEG